MTYLAMLAKVKTMWVYFCNSGRHSGSMVSIVASRQASPGFDTQPGQGLSVWSLYDLPVFTFPLVLQLPPL